MMFCSMEIAAGGVQEPPLQGDKKLSYYKKFISLASSFLKNKYNLLFLGILIITFLLRLKYIGQESLWNDGAVHLWFAQKLVEHPLFFFNPDYLMGDYTIPQTITAFFYLFTHKIFLAGKMMAMLYALAGITFMYLLGSELKNKLTGVIAAALLAFNHIFWFYSVRVLADSPLLVTTIILLYCVVKLEKTKKLKWGILTGVMFLAAVFTKVQSSLFIFAFLFYYLLFKRKEMIKQKAVLVSWIIPAGFLLLAQLIGKVFFHAQILDRIWILVISQRGMPFGFEAAGMLQWIVAWYMLVLALIGLIMIIIYKNKEYYFGIVLFLVYWIFFEVCVDNTQDRYMLPLLSVVVILAAFAIEEIGNYVSLLVHKKAKYVIVAAIVLLLCWNFYTIGDPLIKNKTYSFTGHTEAAEWMTANVPEGIPIFAGSPRTVRALVGREFAGPDENTLGGSIWYLRAERYLNNRSAFEEKLNELVQKSDVYVEIDVWEYTQPKWYFPITQGSLNYFSSIGFNPVKVVEREVPTDKGLQKTPVIFILKKEQEKDELKEKSSENIS